jgi:phage major head subunit gpT-like protein
MLGSLGDLKDLSEAGEFQNQSIPDGRKQSVSVRTKGAIINLTRQAIINDDLGAFVGLAQARGQAAARTIENAVYTALALNSGYGPLLSDGKSIIHADHGNIAATVGAPSVATVESGVLKMAAQRDLSGHDYLDLRPSIALVPAALEVTTRVLNTSTNDPAAATGSAKNPNIPNPFAGVFADIVASQRLAATKWYVLADPSVSPVLEVSFLNGVQEPVMEMELGFSTDGARWKTRLDFGVSGVGYEGIVYNAGL